MHQRGSYYVIISFKASCNSMEVSQRCEGLLPPTGGVKRRCTDERCTGGVGGVFRGLLCALHINTHEGRRRRRRFFWVTWMIILFKASGEVCEDSPDLMC